jgi:hypothetical protein
MSHDFRLHDELRPVLERYVGQARDPVWLCRQLQLRLSELEKAAQHKRTPSGSFSAAVVKEILNEGSEAFSRAKTEKHDMRPFVEACEGDRPTPEVSDPRREP